MTHPAVPACLCTPYSVKNQKGGTLLDEDVTTFEEHERRLADVDGYRPPKCNNCGGTRLHAHDFRERILRADPDRPVTTIRRYDCAHCDAVWQVMPVFIARHLHRRWTVVEAATGTMDATPSQPSVPERTTQRWLHRLALTAVQLSQLLVSAAGEAVATVVSTVVSPTCSRGQFAFALTTAGLLEAGHPLELLAGWVHRLMPGVRLM